MKSFPKKLLDKFPINVSFSSNLGTGETISTVSVKCYDAQKTETTSSMIRNVTHTNTDVSIGVYGGTYFNYNMAIVVTTNLGNDLQEDIVFCITGNLAANALTTLEPVLIELKLFSQDEDYATSRLLERKINAYSEWVERALGRKLGRKNYVEKYSGNNRQRLLLNQWPIININSIKVNGDTLDAALYECDANHKLQGVVYKTDGWTAESYLMGLVGEPGPSLRTIEVNYDAGYVLPKDDALLTPRTLPYDLEDLVIALIAYDYAQQGSKGLKSFKITDVEWVWNTGLAQQYQAILDRYKSRRV